MRRACLLLLLLCLVALPGCVPESYLLVTPHNSQRGENSDVITVENYAAMRSNLVQQVDRHAEQVSMVTYSYAGDVEQDLQRALDYIQSSYPMGAYALEDATYEIVQVASFYQLQLQLTYSHSAWEMEQITQVRMENLENTIGEAITAGRGRQTLMISGFSNVDFAALCRSYLLEHPDQVLQLPQVERDVLAGDGQCPGRGAALCLSGGRRAAAADAQPGRGAAAGRGGPWQAAASRRQQRCFTNSCRPSIPARSRTRRHRPTASCARGRGTRRALRRSTVCFASRRGSAVCWSRERMTARRIPGIFCSWTACITMRIC